MHEFMFEIYLEDKNFMLLLYLSKHVRRIRIKNV